MALYCAGFAGYLRALLPWHTPEWSGKVIGLGLIVAVVVVNFVGTEFVGRPEIFVVTVELAILGVFVVLGATRADPGRFADNGRAQLARSAVRDGPAVRHLRGVRRRTNSAGDMRDPARELPRAMFLSLGIVIVVYILVSAVIVMTVTLPAMDASQGHVLSEAGQQILGRIGFVVIGVAALLATASGVNATMYGDANVGYMVSKSGELPADFARGSGAAAQVACSSRRPSPPGSYCSFRLPRWARWRAWRSSSSTPRSASAIFVCTARPARSRGCWCSRWR
jgi:amino acid transporter